MHLGDFTCIVTATRRKKAEDHKRTYFVPEHCPREPWPPLQALRLWLLLQLPVQRNPAAG